MRSDLPHLWSLVEAELSSGVEEATYRIWLEPLQAADLCDDTLTITAPAQTCGWVRERFGRLLQTAVAAVLGPEVTVDLLPSAATSRSSRSARSSAPDHSPTPHAPDSNLVRGRRLPSRTTTGGETTRLDCASADVPGAPAAAASQLPTALSLPLPALEAPPSSLADRSAQRDPGRQSQATASARHSGSELLANPKLTFEQFVIGDCNRLAHAAALTVAEMPSQAYNPLFICGPPGVGKTHLLQAIRALLLAHDPGLIVRSITGEQFTNEFLHALGDGSTDGFKARFRRADVLLIDDVQILERKAATGEEFFHTFNALYDAGSQIVLTCDRPPRDLSALEDRLRERFEAGLVADIRPPDRATRLTILRKRVAHDRLALPDDQALHLLADRVTSNVRALEGALIRAVAFSSLTSRPLTSDLMREVLDGLYPAPRRAASHRASSVEAIQAAACRHFGVTAEQLRSNTRVRAIAWPRQIAMYLARELTNESLPAIGRHFGGRDHTTVLHAWRRTAKLLEQDESSRLVIDELRAELSHAPRL